MRLLDMRSTNEPELLAAWRKWKPDHAPFLLGGDHVDGCVMDWNAAIDSDDFGRPDDHRVHLGLLPHPYCGDILKARVYILMLNPGLNPADYFGEYQVPSFREAVLTNIKQRFRKNGHPFMFLDPQFSWHSGFRWWHGKLAAIIQRLSEERQCSFAEARKAVAQAVASIELVPYHSRKSKAVSRCIRDGLESARLASGFVSQYVMPRVRKGTAVVIVTRKAELWGVSKQDAVIYSGSEARAAHLTPNSSGGKAILKCLL